MSEQVPKFGAFFTNNNKKNLFLSSVDAGKKVFPASDIKASQKKSLPRECVLYFPFMKRKTATFGPVLS